MQAEALLKVIANQLIIMNRLKHIQLSDRNDFEYYENRQDYLDDIEKDINKDEQYIEG